MVLLIDGQKIEYVGDLQITISENEPDVTIVFAVDSDWVKAIFAADFRASGLSQSKLSIEYGQSFIEMVVSNYQIYMQLDGKNNCTAHGKLIYGTTPAANRTSVTSRQ